MKMFKKSKAAVSAVLLFSLLLACGLCFSACQDQPYSVGLAFRSEGNGTCVLTGIGKCEDVEIRVPERSPLGDLVVAVEDHAFAGNSELLAVHFSSGIKSIGVGAFSGCTKLEQITLNRSLQLIDVQAFADCIALARVQTEGKTEITKVPVTGAGSGEVLYTLEYPMVFFPDSLTEIGESAFAGCAALSQFMVLEDSLLRVGDCAFLGCSSLRQVYIEGKNGQFGEDLFRGNEGLTIGHAASSAPDTYAVGWNRLHATAFIDPLFEVDFKSYVAWFVNNEK